MKANPSRMNLVRVSLMTACLGLAVFLATRLVPTARADGRPGNDPTCNAAAWPCGGFCTDVGAVEECRIELNGWGFGSCGLPNNKTKPCSEAEAGCGGLYDCDTDDLLGPCNLGDFDVCVQK